MNPRLYISDTFRQADSETLGTTRHRSVISAIACKQAPSRQTIEAQRQTALAALGMPVLHSGVAMIPGDLEIASIQDEPVEVRLLKRHAQWQEVKIAQWDELYGPHIVDLVDAPSGDEFVVLVRVCGLSPQGTR